jgi:hypothetical protein
MHIWSDVNPHSTFQPRHQKQFSLNSWAGNVELLGSVVGFYVLPHRLNDAAYSPFFQAHFSRITGHCATGYFMKHMVHA